MTSVYARRQVYIVDERSGGSGGSTDECWKCPWRTPFTKHAAIGSAGDRQKPSQDADKFSTLELTDVRYDDSGAYTAVASNTVGTATARCVLEVINKIRTDPAAPEFVYHLPAALEAAGSVLLNAQVDAYRPVKVHW